MFLSLLFSKLVLAKKYQPEAVTSRTERPLSLSPRLEVAPSYVNECVVNK